VLVTLLLAGLLYVLNALNIKEPVPASLALPAEITQPDSGLFVLGNNWFRKSESGLYELHLEGPAFERGVANGKLTRSLVQYQEKVFNDQIHDLVPSKRYLSVLKVLVGWFNRNMDEHVPEEFKQEIYGISLSASPEFDHIAPAYQRILNYHAAHDIGHGLQNMSLVGCTSFATWGATGSEDSTLIIGRNFDFYVGDAFAENKIVAFYKPENGNPFVMITFGGMTGVLSGMNDQGLTVTINAAKSEIPSAAAMPVSLVAREILQYATTIEEAFQIARKRQMFVSESFLIGSAKDNRAAIIEKTPDEIALFESGNDYIICTNHFQSELLGISENNQEHVRTSASAYRYARVRELLVRNKKNSVSKTASILRDQNGMNDRPIGMGNEKAINQLIAHHGIIFQPAKKLVWISTAPWQLGKFICYDLTEIFSGKAPDTNHEIYDTLRTIPADSFLTAPAYRHAVKFNQYRFPFNDRSEVLPDSLISWNPNSYQAFMLAGDIYLRKKDYRSAVIAYQKALKLEIATLQERDHIVKNLELCQDEIE
jgi:hypothetical protein